MRRSFASRSSARPDFVVDKHGYARPAKRAGAAALLGLAGAGSLAAVALAPGTEAGDALIASSRAAVRSATDLIRARSPGIRSRAYLIKTKFERPAPRTAPALPRLRPPAPAVAELAPPPAPTPLFFESPDLAPAFPALFAGPLPIFDTAAGVPCCFTLFNPPLSTIGGFGIGGFGGGGGGVVAPIGGGGGPPPGVPEPASWTMMILGFGAIGTAWRRRRKLLGTLGRIPLLFHVQVPLIAYAPKN
jgi:hypothetical protein